MKKNVGTTDRVVRIVAAIIIAVMYFTHIIDGTLAIVLGAVAIILLATSFISFCPLYKILGINSCKIKSETKHI